MEQEFNTSRFNNLHSAFLVTSKVASFGGVSLDTAVSDAHIIDVEIGAAKIELSTRAKTPRNGVHFIKRRSGTRQIKITVELPMEKSTYALNAQSLIRWATSDEPKELTLSALPLLAITAVLESATSLKQKEWWQPITLTFLATDPYFYSRSNSQEDVGTSFDVEGDAPVEITITHEIATTLTKPKWTIDNGIHIQLTGTYASGTIVIDTEKFLVTRNDTPIQADIAITSRFGQLEPGEHIVTGPNGGEITWTERWL